MDAISDVSNLLYIPIEARLVGNSYHGSLKRTILTMPHGRYPAQSTLRTACPEQKPDSQAGDEPGFL